MREYDEDEVEQLRADYADLRARFDSLAYSDRRLQQDREFTLALLERVVPMRSSNVLLEALPELLKVLGDILAHGKGSGDVDDDDEDEDMDDDGTGSDDDIDDDDSDELPSEAKEEA